MRVSAAQIRQQAQRLKPVAPPRSGEEELEALHKRWQEQAKQYLAVANKETSYEKLEEAARRFLPTHDAKELAEFFKLEKRHRGKSAGLLALNYLMMRAAQLDGPDLPIAKARERALDVLHKYYLKHEDLDLVMQPLRGGPIVFGDEKLLKAASESSPHEHVRAAALYFWAGLLHHKARYVASRRKDREVKTEPLSARDKRFQELDRKTLLRMGAFDEKEARKEAVRLAKKVVSDYPRTAVVMRLVTAETEYAPKRFEMPKKSVDWNSIPYRRPNGEKRAELRTKTYAELAEALIFKLTQLAVGQKAPPVEGLDVDDKKVRLQDYKGKVVVLMFSANWCGPCKATYPSLRELQKKYKGKPLEIISVMADVESATVRQAVNKGDITWRAIWDGESGPIATKWNVDRYPTFYVMDQQGVIRARDGSLADVVGKLLKDEK